MTHTPGPWVISTQYANGKECDDHIFINPGVAVIERRVDGKYDMENAHLIAAAPDLLAAAKLVLALYTAEDNHDGTTFSELMQMCRDSETAIREAIAKATGQA